MSKADGGLDNKVWRWCGKNEDWDVDVEETINLANIVDDYGAEYAERVRGTVGLANKLHDMSRVEMDETGKVLLDVGCELFCKYREELDVYARVFSGFRDGVDPDELKIKLDGILARVDEHKRRVDLISGSRTKFKAGRSGK